MTNSRLHDNIILLPIPIHALFYWVYRVPFDCNEYNNYVNIMHNPGWCDNRRRYCIFFFYPIVVIDSTII